MTAAVDYDAIVLDVMLPGRDGFEVCRELRERGVWAPVLMLTARTAVEDRISGSMRRRRLPAEAVRVRRAVRPAARACPAGRARAAARARGRRPAARSLDASVWRGETEIELSTKEFALLETFMRRPGQVLSRYQLLEHAWDIAYENKSNVVDVYVRYLREKVDRPFGVESLETVRGAGYRLAGGGLVSRWPLRVRLTVVFAAGERRRARGRRHDPLPQRRVDARRADRGASCDPPRRDRRP